MSEGPSEEALNGSCHCGGVVVRVSGDPVGTLACHCADCQRLHGNFFAFLASDAENVRFEGDAKVSWYRSSETNERGFCERCGARIGKRPVGGSRLMLSVGLFPKDRVPKLTKNLWSESKPDWYELPRVGEPPSAALVRLAFELPSTPHRPNYGYSLRVASGNSSRPGVVALTWIAAKNEAERERIRAHSKKNVEDFVSEPGFISIVTGFTGLRGFTVTAWEDEDSLKRALGKHHALAMRELFGEDFVAAVWTSVWVPGRLNRLWVRCPSCGALEDTSEELGPCAKCGSEMPERPAFW